MPKNKKPSAVLEDSSKISSVDAPYLSKPVHLQTREDRYEAGRALREKCPREAHGAYSVNRPDRTDPIQLLIESSYGRIETLLPLRWGRMLASPFTFFRGAAAVMAADLASTPTTNYAVQACGDCHLMNFGAFATPERNIVFDINDFDETFPAPWEWDLKRLAASFVIASRNNGHKPADGKAAAAQMVLSYRDRMRELSEMKTLEAWYNFIDYEELIELTNDPLLKKRRKKVLAKAVSRSHLSEFVKLAHVVDGDPKIKDQPPLIYHQEGHDTPEYKERIMNSVETYRRSLPAYRRVLFDRYQVVDNAIKVVGVGSVGTTCGIVLLFAAEEDPLFLQVKEARQSVLEPYTNVASTETHGERVVNGQRLMQAASDLFLGHYINNLGMHFYVRQLRDVKVKPLVEIYSPQNMLGFARNCGWALARAHARSGDACIIAGYIGKGKVFASAIGEFAEVYLEQNDLDHQQLVGAVREGTIDAIME